MARSRCLAVYWGILGLADSRKRSLHEPVSTRQGKYFFFSDFCFFGFFFAQDFGRGVFLWEKRSMIDLPIRSCVRPGFVWARRGRGFFPKDSYLGVLRLFLRVLEVARSRRLGSVGEVSVWPDPVLHKNQPLSWDFQIPFFISNPVFSIFFAQEFGRAFSLLEKRSMIDFPIRSY